MVVPVAVEVVVAGAVLVADMAVQMEAVLVVHDLYTEILFIKQINSNEIFRFHHPLIYFRKHCSIQS